MPFQTEATSTLPQSMHFVEMQTLASVSFGGRHHDDAPPPLVEKFSRSVNNLFAMSGLKSKAATWRLTPSSLVLATVPLVLARHVSRGLVYLAELQWLWEFVVRAPA